jgi:carboxylate-amine ligase
MLIDFAPSRQSSVGIEWELALVDLDTGELSPSAEPILTACGAGDETPIRKEFLKNMVELVSGVQLRVGDTTSASSVPAPTRSAARPTSSGSGAPATTSSPSATATGDGRWRSAAPTSTSA